MTMTFLKAPKKQDAVDRLRRTREINAVQHLRSSNNYVQKKEEKNMESQMFIPCSFD